MLVLVGPSASGKSAIVKELMANYGMEKFITCTTREKRVGEIDGVKIVKVPRRRMPANCEFIIAHPSVTTKAEKLDDYKIHQDPPGINGNLVEGRVYYDAFVLNNKKKAIYAHSKA